VKQAENNSRHHTDVNATRHHCV